MHNEKNCFFRDSAHRNPSLFLFAAFVSSRQCPRIVECKHCRLKAYVVFQQICTILVLIPLETHRDANHTGTKYILNS